MNIWLAIDLYLQINGTYYWLAFVFSLLIECSCLLARTPVSLVLGSNLDPESCYSEAFFRCLPQSAQALKQATVLGQIGPQ